MKQVDITRALLLLHRRVAKELKKEELFKKVVSTIKNLVRCDGCAILLVEDGKISISASIGFSKDFGNMKFDVSFKPIAHILKTGTGLIIRNTDKSRFSFCLPKSCQTKCIMCVPVKLNGKVSGIIHLDSKKANTFTKEDFNFVKLVSSELSSIIERSLLYSELEQLSLKDHLTGCYNRRHLYNDLNKRIEECKRYKKVFSIIMMDFDNFKKYNDRFGHSRGDLLLKFICRKLRKILRKADSIYRYGGDEFVVLLPETNKEGAKVCARRLEENVERMNKKIDEETKITLSTGVAGYPEDGSTPMSLIKIADRQMYKNKSIKKTSH
ncbi:MAG: sensor domain-containing diguanylate cyclase [Candidatus Omnitrophica bacterium]|nr:sensor domain-containing diguanylate cyclase [Candidatus Omnitrophota bacterium]